MKFSALLLSLLAMLSLFVAPALAQQTEVGTPNKKAFLKLGLLHTHSTQAHPDDYTNNLSFNLLSGKSYNEYGFNLNGLVGVVKNEARGVQISGFYLRMNHLGKGLSVTGAYSIVNKYDGMVVSLIFSSVLDLRGVQLGVITSARRMEGVQLGVITLSRNAKGVQLGLVNVVDTLRGVQLGVLNIKQQGGTQVGIVNISEHNDYPVGWVNIVKGGEKKVGLQMDELTNTIATFRSGGKVLYGIVGIGYNLKSKNHLMALEGGWGAHLNLSSRFRIDAEMALTWMLKARVAEKTYRDIDKEPEDDNNSSEDRFKFRSGNEEEDDNNNGNEGEPEPTIKDDHRNYRSMFKASIRILPTYKLGSKIEIFAGPSINYLQTKDASNRRMFPSRSLWKQRGERSSKQLYVGFMGGVSYSF